MPRAGRARLSSAVVVAAAAELADAEGLDALTLARLADRLGVRSPSLYAHVDGLDDLRARLAAAGAARLYEALAPAAAGRAGADALYAVADAYRAFAESHPGLYAALQAAGTSGEAAAIAGARVVEVLRAVLRGYGLEGEDAVHAVRTVRSALHGFVSLQHGGGFGMATSVPESWTRMLVTLDRGLSATSPRGAVAVRSAR